LKLILWDTNVWIVKKKKYSVRDFVTITLVRQ
jgi:hypothetical protein